MNSRLVVGASRLVASAALLALAGCASESTVRQYVPQIVTPYRIDIQQGNFITQDMLDKLAVGQTREQVRFIMGTPLVADMFHASRWDYVFRASKGWRDPESRRLVIHFDADGRVARWESEGAPAPRESANSTPAPAAADKPAPATDKPPAVPEPAASPAPGGGAPAAGSPTAASAPAPESPPMPPAAAPRTVDPVTVASASPPASAPTVSASPAAPAAVSPAPAVVAAASATTPVASPVSPSRVLAALESWRTAWSARDVERYLAMYASDFRVPAGLTRARWEAQRRERIRKPSFIVVKVLDPQVSLAGDSAATAVFTQVYESDSLKESGRKTLALVQQGGDWKIRDERFEK